MLATSNGQVECSFIQNVSKACYFSTSTGTDMSTITSTKVTRIQINSIISSFQSSTIFTRTCSLTNNILCLLNWMDITGSRQTEQREFQSVSRFKHVMERLFYKYLYLYLYNIPGQLNFKIRQSENVKDITHLLFTLIHLLAHIHTSADSVLTQNSRYY
ncbi:uncharacterized protein YALI1_A14377g [Yarrowia lipolytica]|uniref:Uncharacterized protein n=1 Tax=Yarrowia lipolytica TaxID=4952 RepID=A0A1D8N4S7_YARLL|nr:hypothetical protein YALI1_A14377g [Yarrowia lipolytica]